jgi:tetratricopeptide (TPR) repeat protein
MAANGDTPAAVLTRVASLLDKSLLIHMEPGYLEGEAAARVGMLETIRQFALEQLAASGEAEAVRERHAHAMLALTEEAAAAVEGMTQGVWLDRLETEHDNLRAALDWAQGRDPGAAVRLGAALWRFWWIRGHLSEGLGWLERVLSCGDGAPSAARVRALNGAAVLARERGDLVLAEARAAEALTLACASEDLLEGALALNTLGSVAADRGDDQRAEERFAEALALWRTAGDRRGMAAALGSLGHVVWNRGELQRATTFFGEAASLCREIGEATELASNLSNLGLLATVQGDPDRAMPLVEEALELAKTLGDRHGVVHGLLTLTEITIE